MASPQTTRSSALALLAATLAFGACTPETGDDSSDSADSEHPRADEGTIVEFDARDYDNWVYFDLESEQVVNPPMPEQSQAWDLAMLRFNVAVNGGTSGTGGVEVAILKDVAFADVDVAPTTGYVTDASENGPVDMETMPGFAFDLWYDYDISLHVLVPNGTVYVVRTVEGNYFKVEVLDYYDGAGSPGYMTLLWAPVDPPA